MSAEELAYLKKKIGENDTNSVYWNEDIEHFLWEHRHALLAGMEKSLLAEDLSVALRELRTASKEEAVGGERWAEAMQQADEVLAMVDRQAAPVAEDLGASL